MLPPLRKALGGEGSLTQGFYSADTDGMRFAATISTSPDQTAVAPGTLVKEWQEGGRRFFRYVTAKPIDGDWTIASARYVTVEDRWRDIPIFVHHHPSHAANVPLMIEGMKLGLEYCVNAFGPYQYGELRLAEYPYATIFAATAQPAMISYSETAGFIADVGASRTIARQIVSITAHEVAHQWWGYQVASANRRGAQFLSESLAEYTAHMVVRKRFGAAFARSNVARGVNAYLKARGGALDEQPLIGIDNKTDRNVYYGKGSAALYALWEVVGEEALNKSLARFIREYVGKTRPYPVAEDLMRILKEDLGPERHELIGDLFERITLWSFEVKAAKSEKRGDGKWSTELTLSAGKAVATSEGAETARPLDQRVPITVYEQDPRSQMRTRFETAFARLKDGEQTVTLATAMEPKFLTVNASRALIQRDIDKSTIEVGR
jgi:ABC-2 type transport system permease protein